MPTEAQIKCASAGMSLIRDHESYKAEFTSPTIFPATNLRGLVTEEDLKVPWSELAMHTKVAEKEVLAFALVGSATAIVITDDGAGGCEYHRGLQNELLSRKLIEKTNEMFKRKKGAG